MRTVALLLLVGACAGPSEKSDPAVEEGDSATDPDGDGFYGAEDCAEGDVAVHPGAPELCDGVDNNCDGEVDEGVEQTWYADRDGDGFGDPDAPEEACEAPEEAVVVGTDCDDSSAESWPGAPELCDGLDNNCDGDIDEDDQQEWYPDGDGDGYGDESLVLLSCSAPEGHVAEGGDCDDAASTAFPGAPELCDEIDNDCDGEVDEEVTSTFYADRDADGWGQGGETTEGCAPPEGYAAEAGDCDDIDPAYHPGAAEPDCADPADYNCDGSTGYADLDADGHAACEECDDLDALVHPGAEELCNLIDDDCDSLVDDADPDVDLSSAQLWYEDDDEDGWGDLSEPHLACAQPEGQVDNSLDCDDLEPAVHPGADELCNLIDDDCDSLLDDADPDVDLSSGRSGWADRDADGYGDPAAPLEACALPAGAAANDEDCDDSDAAISPADPERCDSVDNDCDSLIDDADPSLILSSASTWYVDGDSDGYGDPAADLQACLQPAGTSDQAGDCDDGDAEISPADAEICDGVDNDCDSLTDDADPSLERSSGTLWYDDGDSDGYGDAGASSRSCEPGPGQVGEASDCDDGESDIHPGASEVCDSLDNDCDGLLDDADSSLDLSSASTWYVDSDGDLYGDGLRSALACLAPSGHVADDSDCDDADAGISPADLEVCDGDDNDCDLLVDDLDPSLSSSSRSTWYFDGDGDGYGLSSSTTSACTPPAGYSATGGDCDDADAGVYPDSSGLCVPGRSCKDILDSGLSTGNGTYTIDPDGAGGSAPFNVLCEMVIDGGGWTQALPAYLATLSSSSSREYLYSLGSRWYRSPSTTLVWSWSSYQPLNGTYAYSSGSTTATSSFSCSHAEGGHWGVGCSNGGGGTCKVLPIYASDSANATSTICQDCPNAFGGGVCQTGVSIWVRP